MTEPDQSQHQPLQRGNIRLAATVMLVRQAGSAMEVYMVKRPGRGDFPDLHVFPGGKVDDEDWAPHLCGSLEDDYASELLGVAAGGSRYWVAVARECFEECGVLLARRGDEMIDFAQPAVRERFSELRRALLADEISFADLCDAEGLVIACDRLAYFSHWITPDSVPRRFDTRFFLAAMPSDQETLAHSGETADEDWIMPAQALEQRAGGAWQMIEPTVRSLQTLSQFIHVDGALTGVLEGDHLMELTSELRRQGMQPIR
ncbi:MAG: NUDIX hydrolase [Pseudomonadota bacterium]